MFRFEDGVFLLPEIFLALNTLGLLFFGLFQKTYSYTQARRLIQWVLVVLGGTLVGVYLTASDGVFFNGMMLSTPLIVASKEGLLLTVFCVFSLSTIPRVPKAQFNYESPLLLLLSTLGGMIALSANDFLMLFLGLELHVLPLYAALRINGLPFQGAEASLKYFVLGSFGTGMFLFGASLIYGGIGSFDFQNIEQLSTALSVEGQASLPICYLVGAILVLGAFFLKLSAAPFHLWSPDVYAQGSPAASLFIAAAVKVSGLCVVYRLLTGPLSALTVPLETILAVVAGASMLIGAIGGLAQTQFQRLLAYSAVHHTGFLLAALTLQNTAQTFPFGLYLFIYIPMLVLAFGLGFIFKKRSESWEFQLEELKGAGQTHSLFAAFLGMSLLSLGGLPPFGGFLGKLVVLMDLVNREQFALALVAVLSSVVSAGYCLRILGLMYFQQSTLENEEPIRPLELSWVNKSIVIVLLIWVAGFALLAPLTPLMDCVWN